MNEEIQFGLGLDTGKFFTGMRQAKGVVEDFKASGISLGGVLKGAFAGLTIAAITSTAKSLLDFSHQISVTSENLGVSTTFLQQFGYAARKTGSDNEAAEKSLLKLNEKIGEARMNMPEAVAAFDKWKISLKDSNGYALDTQQIAEKIAKRMNEIEDPTKRSAMAFELMGKGGAKLVLALKDLEQFKQKSEGKILSESDIAIMDSANKRLHTLSGYLKVIGGKALAAGLVTFGVADPNASIKKKFAEIDAKYAASTDAGAPEVTKTKEYIAALRELERAKSEQGGINTEMRYIAAMREEDEIRRQLKEMQGDSVEKVKIETELQKAHNKVLEERQKVADEYNRKQKEAAEKQKQADDRRLAMQNEINHASLSLSKAKDNLSDAKNKRSQLSIEDLTTSNFRFGGALGQDQQTAFQIKELERQGEWNRVHGFLDDSKERYDRADKLRASLSTNVVETDRFQFKSLQETSKEAADHLQELVDKATRDGIKVVLNPLP